MFKAEEYRVDVRQIGNWNVTVTSYKIGDNYFCHVDNVNPGATIARTQATTREEAVKVAVHKAEERLSKTSVSG